jgi:hypothetical protein
MACAPSKNKGIFFYAKNRARVSAGQIIPGVDMI